MTIERITDEDIPEVSEVMRSAYGDAPWHENWSVDRAFLRVKAILSNYRAMGLKACDEDGIQGALLGYVDPYAQEDFFFVSELFVKSERKGQKIGSMLLQALDASMKEEGIQVIQLIAIQNNQSFYKRNGLEKDKVDVMYKRMDAWRKC